MTTLRLIENPPGPAAAGAVAPARLPAGRHGLPADWVRTNQRLRLIEAAATALAEQGYARVTVTRIVELAGISSRTFYEHFDDLWSCLAAAYESEAHHLCREVESAGTTADEDRLASARAGIGAALEFLASESSVARLITAEPPPQAEQLVAAKLWLTNRLGAWLKSVRGPADAQSPPALERRLIGSALALVSTYVISDESDRLPELEPALSEFLLAPL